MFDISFFELLVIAVVGLFVIGPERLPTTIRTVALWIGRIKRSIMETRREIEQQLGADEIRRELQNEQVMRNWQKMKDTRADLEAKIKALGSGQTIEHDPEPALGANSAESESVSSEPANSSAVLAGSADADARPPASGSPAAAPAAAGSPAAGSPAAGSSPTSHSIRSFPPVPDEKTGPTEPTKS